MRKRICYIGSRKISFLIRDGEEGFWDNGIISEVIEKDCYNFKSLKKRDINVMVDIGAHIGSFSIMARILFPESIILSFEPDTENFNILIENTKNLSIDIFNFALSSGSEEWIGYQKYGPNTGSGKIDQSGKNIVRALNVQSLVRSLKQVDIMKIDCEGSEEEIIRSLYEDSLLNKIKMIIGEWHGDSNRLNISNLLSKTHDFTHSVISNIPLGYFEAKLKGDNNV